MPYKDPVKQREKQKEYYQKNREQQHKDASKYREDIRHHAIDSIMVGEIIDKTKWNARCNMIKSSATCRKQPYSDDFTNDIIFEMMLKGCFYCGELATTIDRIDSKLEHTPGNCVGSCNGCNISKGASDPATFIKKAYYRARGEYYDDDSDVWFVNKQKPRLDMYNTRAKKQRVPFELTKSDFETLVNGDCEYCHRSPTTWFGIDRMVPSEGYVLGNVVSCCWDCNNDKSTDDVDTMISRNERIAVRVDTGELVIEECEKVILHIGRVV
jgi:hypothetical protein